jgi:hypothetical protein
MMVTSTVGKGAITGISISNQESALVIKVQKLVG